MKKFVCPVCGYVYEGEEMPADFKCLAFTRFAI